MPSLLNVDDYERAAQYRLEASIYDYIAGGSWDEVTLTENHTAYDEWRLRPRTMVAVNGEAGARAVLELLRREIDTTLALVGCPRAIDLSSDFVTRRTI